MVDPAAPLRAASTASGGREACTTDRDSYEVRVCQHDKSRDGDFGDPKDPDSADSSVLTKCESRFID